MSYLKGKDIKVKGDCLVYCFTKRLDIISSGSKQYRISGYEIDEYPTYIQFGNSTSGIHSNKKPEGFEKW